MSILFIKFHIDIAILKFFPYIDHAVSISLYLGTFPQTTTLSNSVFTVEMKVQESYFILNALNNDDLNGIYTGFDINWSPSRIKDFQLAMDTARFEREFCSDDSVS